MQFSDESGRLVLRDGGVRIAEYVYLPTEPSVESPRPYALLRTRSGAQVTAYRPDDHVWHKGLSLALPVVGDHNFWGGPTYVRGAGYVQQANNGSQIHRSFSHVADAASDPATPRIDEEVEWLSQDLSPVLSERRRITARAVDADTWALTWRSELRNVTDAALGFGSPTTKGRDNAGYAGIFWRGPTSFTGGEIIDQTGAAGEHARGASGPWLAFVSPDRSAGVLMLDASETPTPWFARSEEYAGLNPAPFFHEESQLLPDDTLVLAAAIVIGNADVADHARGVGEDLVAELRAGSAPR